jgi:hypothetical protein
MKLDKVIHSQVVSSIEIEIFTQGAKAWLQLFLTVYQTKHVTPYMHACNGCTPTRVHACSYMIV